MTVVTEEHRLDHRYLLSALALLASLAPAVTASAQSDPAAAEALFREGRALSDAGDIAGACAKFRESARLDPALGTTFNIADCEERLGHLARAWTLFDEVAQRLPASDKRRAVAQARAAGLQPRLPKLSVRLAPGAPADARVSRDGIELGPASLGTPLPVDPGEHVVVVSATGRAARQFKLIISERESRMLEVEPGPEQPAGVAQPLAVRHGGASAAAAARSPALGYVATGVGVAGLITGAVAGALVLSKKAVVDDHCNQAKECDDEGLAASRSGKTLAVVTSVGLVTGVLGLGAGTYLILSAGSGDERAEASFSLTGRF